MHLAVTDFVQSVRAKFPASFQGCRVLEVGSRYINGTIRTYFRRCEYTGLDLAYGPLVDVVCHAKNYIGGPFDTVVSCEALEHDRDWQDTLVALRDRTKPGGLLVLTCAGPGRPEHGTHRSDPASSPATNDYYGNVDEGMFWSAIRKTDFSDWRLKVADGDLTFWGVKG